MADLEKLLHRLNIDEEKRSNSGVFSVELEATEFTIFQPLDSIGYFSWKPSGGYKSLSSMKLDDEIIDYVDLDGEPHRLKSIEQIKVPMRFQSSHLSDTRKNRFPYGETEIACIYVAVKVSMYIFSDRVSMKLLIRGTQRLHSPTSSSRSEFK
jgi:hypothetical protein